MKMIIKSFLMVAGIIAATQIVNASALVKNDGSSVDGEWISIKDDSIEVKNAAGHQEIALADLDSASQTAVKTWASNNPSKVNLYLQAEVMPTPVKSSAPVNDGIAGMVAVLVTIDEGGNVLNAEIKKSTDDRLNDRSISAIKEWRFKPAEVNGEKVKTQVVIPLRYS